MRSWVIYGLVMGIKTIVSVLAVVNYILSAIVCLPLNINLKAWKYANFFCKSVGVISIAFLSRRGNTRKGNEITEYVKFVTYQISNLENYWCDFQKMWWSNSDSTLFNQGGGTSSYRGRIAVVLRWGMGWMASTEGSGNYTTRRKSTCGRSSGLMSSYSDDSHQLSDFVPRFNSTRYLMFFVMPSSVLLLKTYQMFFLSPHQCCKLHQRKRWMYFVN